MPESYFKLRFLVEVEISRQSKRRLEHSKVVTREHIDIGNARFIAYIIVNIIQPKEIP
jgi:hypothetical protein